MTKATQHTLISLSIAVGLFMCVVAAQHSYDSHAPKRDDVPPTSLSAQTLKATDLGLHSALASLLWLNVIQNVVVYLGNSTHGMAVTLETITRLDPYFTYPYAFAVLMLPSLDQKEMAAALDIGTRGVELGLPDWRISYYLGFSYFFYLHDNENAIRYMQATARTPGVPDGIKVTALNFGLGKTAVQQTKEFWQSIYDTAKDDVVRQNAQDNLDHITIIEGLKSGLKIYKARFGAFPKTLNELVTSGILSSIPQDPFGITFGTDGSGNLSFNLSQQ